MSEALAVTGVATKREAVELALQSIIRLARQAEIKKYRDKLDWQGDLEAMRLDTTGG
jgi:Arc/MetJ family transcription regulator